MPRTITLPSSATVTLRDKREITERQRRPFMRLQAAAALEGDRDRLAVADDMIATMDAAVIVCVIGWNLTAADGSTLPVVADSLLDLESSDYDALRDECLETLTKAVPSFEPDVAPDSPTQAASL